MSKKFQRDDQDMLDRNYVEPVVERHVSTLSLHLVSNTAPGSGVSDNSFMPNKHPARANDLVRRHGELWPYANKGLRLKSSQNHALSNFSRVS